MLKLFSEGPKMDELPQFSHTTSLFLSSCSAKLINTQLTAATDLYSEIYWNFLA